MLSTTALMGANAFANETATSELTNFYVQLNGGASLGLAPKKDFGNKKAGTSGLYGIEAGYQFNENFRAGLGIDYRNKYSFTQTINHPAEGEDSAATENNSWKIKSLAVMANVYFDIMEANGFTPYVTLGAGIAKNTVNGSQNVITNGKNVGTSIPKGTKTNFAYKAGLGTRYSFNQNVALDVRYQFADLGKIKSGTNNEDFSDAHNGKLRAHEFLAGISYNF